MRIARIVLGSVLALTALSGPRAQSDAGEADLSLSPREDALLLDSPNPGSFYAIVAGFNRVAIPLPGKLVLTVSPDILVATGVLADSGQARVPVELVSADFAGKEVHFQAGIWTSLADLALPDRLSNRLTAVFRDPADSAGSSSDADDSEQGEIEEPKVEVVNLSPDYVPDVRLLSTDSIPPVFAIVVSAEVRATKAKLTVSPIVHDGVLDPRTLVLSAHLVVHSGAVVKDEETRVVSDGYELGSKVRKVQVRFTSSVENSDRPAVQ